MQNQSLYDLYDVYDNTAAALQPEQCACALDGNESNDVMEYVQTTSGGQSTSIGLEICI